ncbi:MAG: substrate-binding domain-containing protein, partial [Actinomycetota bacterium]|nr:substrate-binding domain-containing protein [Actinomycetota bacterium]
EHASYNATEYLIKKGHKDILLLNGPFQLSVSKDFLKGYLQALMNYGIRVKRSLIKYTELSIEGGYETIKKLYSSKNSENPNIFSAVLSLSDMLAIGVYEASKEIGFKIPDDLSIVGYDNISMSPYLSPPLTTIHAPKIRIGKLSIKILLDQIENKDKEFHKIILDTRLIERDSVKDINVK